MASARQSPRKNVDDFTKNLRDLLLFWLRCRNRKPAWLEQNIPESVIPAADLSALLNGQKVFITRTQAVDIAGLLKIPLDKVLIF